MLLPLETQTGNRLRVLSFSLSSPSLYPSAPLGWQLRLYTSVMGRENQVNRRLAELKCVGKSEDLPLENGRRKVSKDKYKRAESKDRV